MSSCSIINRPNNENHKLLHPHCHIHTRANLLFVLLGFSQITGVYDGTSDETLISTDGFFFYGCQVCRPPPQMTKYVTLFFPLLRPGDPWTAALLRAAVPEPTGDAGETLRGAAAQPGHSPGASPPHHAPLGCLPGIREAAAPGLYSAYTYSHERCWHITTIWWLFCLERAQNAHKPNLPPVSSLNSNSSWSHQLNKSKTNEVAQGLPSHVSDSFPSRSGNQSEWHYC